MTWGTIVPANPTAEPITITAVEPLTVTGVEVIQIVVNDPASEGAIGAVRGFPPPGVSIHPVSGYVLPPAGSPTPYRQILVAARLSPASTIGSIGGLRVTYQSGGHSYTLVIPGTLTLTLAAPSS